MREVNCVKLQSEQQRRQRHGNEIGMQLWIRTVYSHHKLTLLMHSCCVCGQNALTSRCEDDVLVQNREIHVVRLNGGYGESLVRIRRDGHISREEDWNSSSFLTGEGAIFIVRARRYVHIGSGEISIPSCPLNRKDGEIIVGAR